MQNNNEAIRETVGPDAEGPFMAILRDAPTDTLEALRDWLDEHLWARRWEAQSKTDMENLT